VQQHCSDCSSERGRRGHAVDPAAGGPPLAFVFSHESREETSHTHQYPIQRLHCGKRLASHRPPRVPVPHSSRPRCSVLSKLFRPSGAVDSAKPRATRPRGSAKRHISGREPRARHAARPFVCVMSPAACAATGEGPEALTYLARDTAPLTAPFACAALSPRAPQRAAPPPSRHTPPASGADRPPLGPCTGCLDALPDCVVHGHLLPLLSPADRKALRCADGRGPWGRGEEPGTGQGARPEALDWQPIVVPLAHHPFRPCPGACRPTRA
jgi:hypothetical protein